MSLIIMVVCMLIYPTAIMGADFSATFTDLNQKFIALESPPFVIDISFDVLNSTGLTWTDFHMNVLSLGFPPTFIPDNTANNGTTYTGPGTDQLSGGNTIIDIIGLNIPDTATYSFTLDILSGELGWQLFGYPTVTDGNGSSSVPEPTTMLLLGSGLIGLAGYGRKKFFKK